MAGTGAMEEENHGVGCGTGRKTETETDLPRSWTQNPKLPK